MRHQLYFVGVFVVLAVVYLIQLASPLRMNTDATSFLTLASSYLDGHGFVIDGRPTHFPVGYPLMLVALERSGLASSASIIGINLLSIALGCACTAYLLRRSFQLPSNTIALIGILTLMCWVFVKHATLPLSDLPYFGFAMACLAALSWSIDQTSMRKKTIGFGLTALLMIAAIFVRTVGIALIPTVGIGCVTRSAWRKIPLWFRSYPTRSALLCLAVFTAALAGCFIVVQTRYYKEMKTEWAGWSELARIRTEDWSELVMNTSIAKLPDSLQTKACIVGGIGAIVVCCGMLRRASLEILDLYTFCYAAILVIWPYRDARFWMPIFPIFAAYSWIAYESIADRKWVRRAARVYFVAFCLMGIIALIYSSRISLSGDRFPELYGAGIYRDTYHALSGTPGAPGPDSTKVDFHLVQLIQRFGPRD